MIRYTSACLEATGGHWLSGKPGRSRGPNAPRSIRVFENPFLELMSRAHPITPGVWFGPFIVYAWAVSPSRLGAGATALLFVGGALVFSAFEYGLHRIVFHGLMRWAVTDERVRFAAFMAHGYHHEFPDDRSRLVMPPMISWPLAALFAGVYFLLLGSQRFLPVLAGTMAGYIAYDWIHYYTHHFRPRTRIGKWMRAYHLRHHYQDPNAFFGISSPLWDLAFGTYRGPLPAKRGDVSGIGQLPGGRGRAA
jgi:sterol desaturase/sphingolipid hydroxylase (fatty acid hydroxylase superfamily)